MKVSSLVLLAGIGVALSSARGADATSPVDYRSRNTPFAPAESIEPVKNPPKVNDTVQDKRVEKTTIEKHIAPIGDRRAAIDVTEAREKNVREKDSHRPEANPQPTSSFNHRTAAITTAADSHQPTIVTKYQDSLNAASASNMARYPAMSRATAAKINRFVFRRNGSEPAATGPDGRPIIVTPAAGGSSPQN